MRKHAALVACALVVFGTGGIGIASADSGTCRARLLDLAWAACRVGIIAE
jgi:hypothetical protein